MMPEHIGQYRDHLLGFDHETGDGKMAREEKRFRREFGLAETLIARASKTKKVAR